MASGYNNNRISKRLTKIFTNETSKSHVHDRKLIATKIIEHKLLTNGVCKSMSSKRSTKKTDYKIIINRSIHKKRYEYEQREIKFQKNAYLICL
jgi:hypothetical protein